MNWDLYRVFMRLAETGSIIQAARKLNVSEPTVSRKLDALETTLKAPLFYRGATGVKLTREGEALFRQISLVEELLADAPDKLAVGQGTLQQKVTVSTTSGMTRFWLSQVLPDYAAANPHLQIELRNSYKQIDLADAEIDIVIRFGSPVDDDLVGLNAGQIAFGFFATEAFAERHDLRQLTPSILARVPVALPPIDYSRARKTSSVFDQYLAQDDVNNQLICDDFSLLQAAVEAGTHCASMPLAFCKDIKAIPLPLEAEPVIVYSDIWLLRRRESKQRKAVSQLFDHLKAELARSRDIFMGV